MVWKVLEECSDFEINSEGLVRHRETKLPKTRDKNVYKFHNLKPYRSLSVQHLLWKYFPENLWKKFETDPSEVWKDVVGFEGLYQVSNMGRVRSLPRTVNRSDGKRYTNPASVLTPRYRSDKLVKYFAVKLYKDWQNKDYSIHRLVAEAFIHNPENKPQVNHIDCNPANNNVSNLEWVTQKENSIHMAKLGRGEFKRKRVVLMNLDGEELMIVNGIREASKVVKCARFGITQCMQGVIEKYKGFRFKAA
jgi:hypothetical protein